MVRCWTCCVKREPRGGSKRVVLFCLSSIREHRAFLRRSHAQPYDWFLVRLKADYCVPYQELVQQALLGLQEEEP